MIYSYGSFFYDYKFSNMGVQEYEGFLYGSFLWLQIFKNGYK